MSKHNALTTFGRSGNPMFRGEAFKADATFAEAESKGRMTLAGTVNKTGILLILCLVTASFTWNLFFRTGDPAAVSGLLWIGMIGGLILALITIFKRRWAGITAPLYALAQGLAYSMTGAGHHDHLVSQFHFSIGFLQTAPAVRSPGTMES